MGDLTDREKLESIEKTIIGFFNEQRNHNTRQNNFMIAQRKTNLMVLNKIEEVNRGVYGDKKNKAVGLMDTVAIHGKDISSLKKTRVRMYAYVFAFVAGVNAAFFLFIGLWKNN